MNSFEPFKKFAAQNRIYRVPIDERAYGRYGVNSRINSVGSHDFSLEEIERIIREGDLDSIRRLSRYYYRTNSEYRENIDYLATLPFYDTLVTPIFEEGKGSKA